MLASNRTEKTILIILSKASNAQIRFWLLQPSGFTERGVSNVYKKMTKRALQRARLVPAGAAHKNLNTFSKEDKLPQKLSSFK